MNSSNQFYDIEVLNNFLADLNKYIGPVIYVLGTITNLISIMIFLRKSWRKNVCVFYLTCYLFFNICNLIFQLFTQTIPNVLPYSPQDSNNILCKIYLYMYYLLSTLSPNVLIFASIDRLLISSQNVDTRLYSSKRLAYFSIGISSIIWIIYYIHLLIKSHIQELSPNYFACAFDQSEPYISFAYYSLVGIVFIFCLIVIILCILSFKNVRSIRAVPRQQRIRQVRSMKKKDFQLLRCLYMLDIIYTLFTLLSVTYDVCYAFALQSQAQTLLQQTIYSFLEGLFTFLTIIPYIFNFGIFMIISKAFRHEVKSVWYKMIGKFLIPLPEDENHVQINVFVNTVS